jgi:PQQ-dependent dehydrogenase (methanol/ethanol family)
MSINTMQKTVLAVGMLAANFCLAQGDDYVPVTDDMLRDPDPKDWLMFRRSYDAWGYSPLDQVNRDNVGSLELVWSAELHEGVINSMPIQEGTPLVHDGMMFLPNPGDVIQARDAVTGEMRWEYVRQTPEDLNDYLVFNKTNRNVAIYDDLIIYTTNDAHILALDVRTGAIRWDTRILDYRTHPSFHSSGPVVINGLAISGRNCEPPAGPEACFIAAHDAKTGSEVWRLNLIQAPTGDDSDTWGGIPWEQRWHVGAWMVPSYDPDLDLIYMGTSVTAPAPKFLLAGDDREYLYHNSTLAIHPTNGQLAWHYQHLVDHWDLDHPFERLLVNTRVAPNPDAVPWINPGIDPNKEYRVITGIPGKTGVVYTLDRETGEFLWARPTVYQNVLQEIDGATGKATVNPGAVFSETGQQLEICPAIAGGKNWWEGTYSPLTNAMYYGLQNTCMDLTVTAEKDFQDPDELYGFFSREKLAPGRENVGTYHAISAETGETLWTYEAAGTALSLVSTGGGLVFGGDIEGNFRAFDQVTGEVLWEVNLGSSVTGYPITFAVDGRQYISVGTGTSVTTAGQVQYLKGAPPGTEGRQYVFALP